VGLSGWLVSGVAFLAIGLAATYYLQRVRLPREETQAGVAALAGMRWREFIHLVLAALNRRGYERVFDTAGAGDEGGDYLLERAGQKWLLSSKHGAAYVLGSTAIAEFANSIRMRSAAGGLLVTPGQFAPEARPLASAQRIELLDGPTLWPELRPLLPQEQRDEIAAPAQARARRHILMSWGGAFAVAAVLLAVFPNDAPEPEPATAVAGQAAPGPAMQVALPPPAPIPTDPAALERRRSETMRAVSKVPGVERALWSTQSTLLVYLTDDLAEPLPAICPLMERYEELAPTRIQLQPPKDSKRQVRFVQCRSF